jgi:hypothetical protein
VSRVKLIGYFFVDNAPAICVGTIIGAVIGTAVCMLGH